MIWDMLKQNFPCQAKDDFHARCQFIELPKTLQIWAPTTKKKKREKKTDQNTTGFKFQIIPYHVAHKSYFFLGDRHECIALSQGLLQSKCLNLFEYNMIWVACSLWIRIHCWGGHSILLVFISKSLRISSPRYLYPWIFEGISMEISTVTWWYARKRVIQRCF